MKLLTVMAFVFAVTSAFGLGVSLTAKPQFKAGFLAGAEYMRQNTKCEVLQQ